MGGFLFKQFFSVICFVVLARDCKIICSAFNSFFFFPFLAKKRHWTTGLFLTNINTQGAFNHPSNRLILSKNHPTCWLPGRFRATLSIGHMPLLGGHIGSELLFWGRARPRDPNSLLIVFPKHLPKHTYLETCWTTQPNVGSFDPVSLWFHD